MENFKRINFNGENQDEFLGKKIVTKIPKDNSIIVGVCEFIGYNKYLNNVPHIVINRMPIYPADFNNIIVLGENENYDIRFHKFKK